MTKYALKTDLLCAVAMCASNEETRYYLKGVYVMPHDGGAMMVATDGHIMAVAFDEHGEAPEPAILSMDWKRSSMKTPVREEGVRRVIFDKPTKGQGVAGEIVPHQPEHTRWGNGPAIDFIQVTHIDATYPDFRRAVPDPKKGQAHIGRSFDAALIDKLGKAAKRAGFGTRFCFMQERDTDPALVLTHDASLFFVLMPIRWGGPYNMPGWYRRPDQAQAAE